MTKTLLVASVHALGTSAGLDDLMNDRSYARFKEQVLPHITNKSLVLCEGILSDSPITPTHPKYDFIKKRMLGDALTVQPTLWGFDHRQSGSQEKDQAKIARHDLWTRVVQQTLEYPTWKYMQVRTFAQVLELARTSSSDDVRLIETPSSEQVEVARWIRAINRKFDRLYLEGMRKHSPRYDSCVFIGGGAHVVSMALKSEHEAIDLSEAGTESTQMLMAYLVDYVWPNAFIK